MTITVKATREGLAGQTTSTGYKIDEAVPFVALPSRAALWMWVRVTNPANNRSVLARVLDVGPHFTDDNAYVFGNGSVRPRVEAHPEMNGAGIDLGEAVWNALGMTDNTHVAWELCEFSSETK